MLSGLKRLRLGKIALVAGVIVLGGSSIAAAAPAHPSWGHGGDDPVVVTSVNGVPTAGTCGTKGATGAFTVVGQSLEIITVEVTSSTTFTDSADPSPSFLDVCVATELTVSGTWSSGTLTASSVAVVQNTVQLKGVVTSVNGVSTAGTCGVSGAAGNFTVVGKHLHIRTVDVAKSTTFTDLSDPTPSFADVCVGNHVEVTGTAASGVVTASAVTVLPPNVARLKGIVTSVNGVSNPATCGVAAAAGTFTLVGNWRHGIINGAVTTTTAFTDSAVTTPSFADVCVGTVIEVLGTLSSGTLTATQVVVLPAGLGGSGGQGGQGHHGRHGRHGHHGKH